MRKKNTVRITALFIVISLAATMLQSCGLNGFFATLGFDTYDYTEDEVIAEHTADSEVGQMLCKMIKILTINSPDIPEFSGTKEATKTCRNAVLNYLLNQSYSKYAGNLELLEEASAQYPQMKFVVIIPAEDFENTIYRYFGGNDKVSNSSTSMYEYLGKVNAYVTARQPVKNDITVNFSSIKETKKAYIMSFNCTLDGYSGAGYTAVAVKRDDGSCYFKYVEKSN